MRRALKVTVWAVVFLGAAGIGAYVAAHTELFPPEVEGGSIGSPSAAPGSVRAVPEARRWKGVIRSGSYHDLYVGGRCTTRWITKLTFDALDNGRIVGTGTARLDGDRICTFPSAQINADRIDVELSGLWDSRRFEIRLHDSDRSPVGTTDYGGFASTVFEEGPGAVLMVKLDSEQAASATVELERADDQGRGRYVSVNRVSLARVA